jgi:citronellyl-CoA dehydrogenase
MQFTPEHEEFRRTVKQFVDNEINPNVEQWEKEGLFPAKELFMKMGELGLLGVTKPEEYGGLGLDLSYGLVVAEELGAIHCGGIPMAIGVQTDMATPALALHGSKELCEKYLTKAITGEAVFCIGVSEPNAGSDVAGVKTSAVRDGDDYVINGTKMWITNSTQADYMCLLANTSDGPFHKNKSLILVPMDLEGIEVAPKLDKMGMRSSDTAQVFFKDVRVPVENLIGQEGMGFILQMQQFQEERIFAAAVCLKALENCIRETIEYTSQRKAFGKSILDNQVVSFRLAELQVEIESLRALTYRACEVNMQGDDATYLATAAKLKAGRLCREVTDACLQYWGGMGFMNENLISQYYRDMRLVSIGGGADEVMLGILCKFMGTLPKA